MAARAVGVPSSAFMASGWEPGQEVVVAGASGVHVLGCGDQLQVSVWCQGQVADTQRCGGSQSRQQGPGPMIGSLQLCDPGCPCVSPLAAQLLPRRVLSSGAQRCASGRQPASAQCAPGSGGQPGGPCWSLVLKGHRGLDWLPVLFPGSGLWGLVGKKQEGRDSVGRHQ